MKTKAVIIYANEKGKEYAISKLDVQEAMLDAKRLDKAGMQVLAVYELPVPLKEFGREDSLHAYLAENVTAPPRPAIRYGRVIHTTAWCMGVTIAIMFAFNWYIGTNRTLHLPDWYMAFTAGFALSAFVLSIRRPRRRSDDI